jgi:hypothetical protein
VPDPDTVTVGPGPEEANVVATTVTDADHDPTAMGPKEAVFAG